jgi:cation:H+ antiporter
VHGKGSDAIGTLISSKVSQWTLLVGSLPLAYLAGGGGTALVLDGRQVEEFGLTAGQALLGVAALLTLRFPRWLACTLLGLFAVQYAVPGQSGRYLLAAVYGAIALIALIRNRRHILPALAAPFRSLPGSPPEPAPALEPAVSFGPEIERIDEGDELSDVSADASAAAAGYSPPRTGS